jgi:hypothetical protein
MPEKKILEDTIFEMDNVVLTFISQIESDAATYKLGTDIEGLDVDTKFYKKTDSGNFEVSLSLKEGDDFNLEYFFVKPALLAFQNILILIQNTDVIGITRSLEDPPKRCLVEVSAFRGDFDDSKWIQSKQGAYFRFKTSQFGSYKSGIIFDITTNKDQSDTFKNAVLLNIENSPVLFSFEKVTNDYGYFIFRSQKLIDFDKFQKIVNATRVALGLISGYYIADSVYFISSKPSQGVKGVSYRYRNIDETIKHDYPLLDRATYKDVPENELKLNSAQFNNLVELLYKNEEYFRASILLINAGNTINCISKGSMASVALETISNIIGKERTTTRQKVITEKSVESQLKHELQKGMKKIKANITKEQYDILESKINKINEPPNAKKLEDPFKLLRINLDDEELYCLSCRNTFLHGSLPKSKNFSMLNG